MGTGFVVGAHTLMTAAHVAMSASSISIQFDSGGTADAQVVAIAPTADAALLRVQPTLASPLKLRNSTPELGEQVGVLGFPLATNQLQFSQGTVSGPHDPVTYNTGQTVDGLYVTSAPVNPGNSGGPVITSDGTVIGLISGEHPWAEANVAAQGQNYFETSVNLAQLMSRWGNPSTSMNDRCGSTSTTGAPQVSLEVDSQAPDAQVIGQVLFTHGSAINSGEYGTAYNLFTAREKHSVGSLHAWSQGLSTTIWESVTVKAVSGSGPTRAADVELRTTQSPSAGPHGQNCSIWQMRYSMQQVQGVWQIDSVKSLAEPNAC